MDTIADLSTIDPACASPGAIEAADRIARHWTSDETGPLSPGTEAHKRAMCAMFRDTFNPYKPSVIEWPLLEPETLERIVALPIWDIAVQTEGKARLRMAAYARVIDDPEMRDTIARNGWEESRHKEVLGKMVAAYGIRLAPEPPYVEPRDPEWAYLVTGFSECVDSFFAFGLFAMALRSGLFPPALIDTFEPVMQEECRHILLFANWLAWHRARMPLWRRPWFEMRVLAVWAFLAYERIGIATSLDADGNTVEQDNNFTVNGAGSVSDGDVDVLELMGLCLAENERRFAGYDPRLRRPTTMPALVATARALIGTGRRVASTARSLRAQWTRARMVAA